MISISECHQKTDVQLVVLSLKKHDYYYCLMKRYEASLMNYIRKLAGVTQVDAEDILQEVFIDIYQNLNDYDQRFRFSSWIFRIAHNRTISTIRKRRNDNQAISWDEHDLDQLVQSGFSLEGNIIQRIDHQHLLNLIKALPLKYREVLLLKFVEMKDYREISDILKKPIGTIGTLINRAKRKLIHLVKNE